MIIRLMLLIMFVSITGQGYSLESLHYLQVKGEEEKNLSYQFQDLETLDELTINLGSERTTLLIDEEIAVQKWTMDSKDLDAIITADRNGNKINLNVHYNNGLKDRKTLKIGKEPWYQSVPYCLKDFVSSQDSTRVFWSIRLSTLTATRMKAVKLGFEEVALSDKIILAQKVKVSLTGMRSLVWSSYYWFNPESGIFLKYEGVNGPPGTPKTITTFIKRSR